MGFLDSWSSIILDVSMRLFLDEINTEMKTKQKPDCLLWCGWASSDLLKTSLEQKADHSPNKREFLLPEGLPTETSVCLILPPDLSWNISSSWVSSLSGFRVKLELHKQLPWVASLLTADLGTCQPSLLCESILYNKSFFYAYVYTLLVLFLWRTLTTVQALRLC